MLRVRIIHRYLFQEMLAPFAVSLGVFTFVLLIAKIMELTELVVERGVSLEVVGRLLLYTLPYFFVFTLPMATLLGVLLGFLRLSSDNEITAIKAAGVSLRQLLPAPAALALVAALANFYLNVWALPWGNHHFENLIYQVAKARPELALKERRFISNVPGLVMFINEVGAQGTLEGVFLVDERDPERVNTVVAQRGRVLPGPEGRVLLRLFNGTVHAVGQGLKSARTTWFERYEIVMNAGTADPEKRTSKFPKEMTLEELREGMAQEPAGSKRYDLLDMEYQKKFSLPVACAVMALIGVCLGTHWRTGRSWGVILALAVFLVYYILLSLSWSLGDTGYYPPKLGVWLPNVLLGLWGVHIFAREQNERPIPILDNLGGVVRLMSRLRRRKESD